MVVSREGHPLFISGMHRKWKLLTDIQNGYSIIMEIMMVLQCGTEYCK